MLILKLVNFQLTLFWWFLEDIQIFYWILRYTISIDSLHAQFSFVTFRLDLVKEYKSAAAIGWRTRRHFSCNLIKALNILLYFSIL